MNTLGRHVSLLIMALLIGACSPFAPESRLEAERVLPASFSFHEPAAERPERWWEGLADPELSRLIEEALDDNFSVHEAFARLKQADASAVKSGAALYPELSLSSAASRSRQHAEASSRNASDYSLGLVSSYELDLWGRVRSDKEAGSLEATASRDDLEAAAMSVAAEVADRWSRLITQRQLQTMVDAQIETSRTYLELVELRFAKGQASLLDVFQQREAVAKLEAALPPLEAEEERRQHELALLLGKPPKAELGIEQAVIPEPGEVPSLGIPADLLAMRPDVRAAWLRLQAADWQVAAARADRLPAIRLSADAKYSAGHIDTLFDNWLAGLAGSLTAPIFDGRARTAEVERTRAVAEERLATYQRTVLTAVKEVEDALVSEQKVREEVDAVRKQVDIAGKALDQARQRYVKGLNDYLPVLTELQSVHALEQDLVQKKGDLLLARIALHRALGGSWMDEWRQKKAEGDER